MVAKCGTQYENSDMSTSSESPTLPPPEGFATWLDFAVETFDTRGLYVAALFSDDATVLDRDVMRDAARTELVNLRRKARYPASDPGECDSSPGTKNVHCTIETDPGTGGLVGWVVGFRHFGVTGSTPDEVEARLRRQVLSLHESGSLVLECELVRTVSIELPLA